MVGVLASRSVEGHLDAVSNRDLGSPLARFGPKHGGDVGQPQRQRLALLPWLFVGKLVNPSSLLVREAEPLVLLNKLGRELAGVVLLDDLDGVVERLELRGEGHGLAANCDCVVSGHRFEIVSADLPGSTQKGGSSREQREHDEADDQQRGSEVVLVNGFSVYHRSTSF